MKVCPPLNAVVLSIFNFQTRLRTALTEPQNSPLSYETLSNNWQIAKLSLKLYLHLLFVVPHPLHLFSSPLYDVSDHTNHIFSERIWSWQHVSVFITELSPVYCCVVSCCHLFLSPLDPNQVSFCELEFFNSDLTIRVYSPVWLVFKFSSLWRLHPAEAEGQCGGQDRLQFGNISPPHPFPPLSSPIPLPSPPHGRLFPPHADMASYLHWKAQLGIFNTLIGTETRFKSSENSGIAIAPNFWQLW